MHPILASLQAAVPEPRGYDEAALLAHFRRRELSRGTYWLREGKVCRRLCFLERGLLRHTRTDDDGQVRTRWATLPSQFAVNLPSFTREAPSTDSIAAAEPSVVHETDRAAWAELRATYPALQAFWVGTLEHLVACFEDRVYSLISGDAERRYHYMMDRYPEFLRQLPQHDLADMLGIAPRHLSRVRAARR